MGSQPGWISSSTYKLQPPNFLTCSCSMFSSSSSINSKTKMSSNQQISFFRSQLQLRRFDEGTLRILDSILVSKDVESLLELRNGLKKILRSDSVSCLREISEKSIDVKLLLLDFFVRAFALVGDVESCLALRYEALLLRGRVSIHDSWLRVSYEEWLTFAKDSLDNGFYSIAVKGCENALLCFQPNDDAKSNIHFSNAQVVDEIRKVKDVAVALIAPHSVQAQTAEHLKSKSVQQSKMNGSLTEDTRCLASSMFREGIKKRNMRKLRELQSLQ